MEQNQAISHPVIITFPDGAERTYETAVTGFDIAGSISNSLLKKAVAMKVNGVQRDLSEIIREDAKLQILTVKDEEGLEIMRHTTTAQILAKAIKQLWPSAKLAIGPTIDDGFYYDVELKDHSISTEDLPKIEAQMRKILSGDPATTVAREMWSRDEAIKLFESRGESYKADIIRNAAEDDTTEAGKISLYRQGEDEDAFIDLCRGPHVPSFKHISPAFKLMKVSGSYWKGDAQGPKLQRIYGTSWADEKGLKVYLKRLEEAEKRDHRKIGKALDFFHFQEEAQGQVFWHDKGWTLYRLLENFIRDTVLLDGYNEVRTPQLLDRTLWEKSGHWGKFRENMFTVADEDEHDGRTLAIKPMNCPGHVQIFNQGIKSYRELPVRMSEFGTVHRNEPTGALHGLMRVRAMIQDDGHVFCTEDQILSETERFCRLLERVYEALGFAKFDVKLATRPEKRAGSDEIWDKAEKALGDAVTAAGLEYDIEPEEGAFYGPKLEFHLKDAIGRTWQCGTLQLDFVLPERLDASYIGEDNEKHRPVLLHRAILGSLERFLGILIEHYAGKLPLWLTPQQVVVCPITSEVDGYAREVEDALRRAGFRVESDLRNEKIGYKVREHTAMRIPVLLSVGKREEEEGTVSVRRIGSPKNTVQSLDELIADLRLEVQTKHAYDSGAEV